ncbi:MAG: hypothetical protein DRQ49_19275 [Gammaproteobacteria bacterium]|nr:MAG: hypothetical protein DRQ49_19275 [Gammaproteobacteria bacterium]
MNLEQTSVKNIDLDLLTIMKVPDVNGNFDYWQFKPHGFGEYLGVYPYNLKFKTLDEAFKEYKKVKRLKEFKQNNVCLPRLSLLKYIPHQFLVIQVNEESVKVLGVYDIYGDEGPPGGDAVVYMPIPTRESVQEYWKVKNGEKTATIPSPTSIPFQRTATGWQGGHAQ